MLDVLKFVMGDIFHFLGTVILLAVIFDGIVAIIRALRGEDSHPPISAKVRTRLGPSQPKA